MRKITLLCTFVILGCSFSHASLSDNDCYHAKDRLMDFYSAINKHRCEIAVEIRPDYSKERCNEIKSVILNSINPQSCSGGDAFFLINVRIKENTGAESNFSGIAQLKNDSNNHWIIVDVKSISKLDVKPVSKIDIKPMVKDIDKRNNDVIFHAPLFSDKKFSGSTLLNSCWTNEQLRGNLQEKLINETPLDHSPPKYEKPKFTNPKYKGVFDQSIRSVSLPKNQKYIAITFDLCEKANQKTGYDSEIVNYLRVNQVKATLFAGGKWMRSHPERTKQLMADPLFELGNHTWTHGNLRVIHGQEMKKQILWTQAQYEILRDELLGSQCAIPFKNQAEKLIPQVPDVFRFPFGTCDQESLSEVSQQGLAPIQWDIVTGDPAKKQSAAAIEKIILSQAKPGAIIIAHANGRGWNTAQALPRVINELRARGYKFVKVSELLKMGEPVLVDTCYEKKPNDNIKYDKLFGKGTE